MEGLRAMEAYWSDQAATFDEEPDHGLTDGLVRMASASYTPHEMAPRPLDVSGSRNVAAQRP